MVYDISNEQFQYSGLRSLISDLQTPIGGHHPVLYFTTQITEKYSTVVIGPQSRVKSERTNWLSGDITKKTRLQYSVPRPHMNIIRSSHGKFDIPFISGLETAD